MLAVTALLVCLALVVTPAPAAEEPNLSEIEKLLARILKCSESCQIKHPPKTMQSSTITPQPPLQLEHMLKRLEDMDESTQKVTSAVRLSPNLPIPRTVGPYKIPARDIVEETNGRQHKPRSNPPRTIGPYKLPTRSLLEQIRQSTTVSSPKAEKSAMRLEDLLHRLVEVEADDNKPQTAPTPQAQVLDQSMAYNIRDSVVISERKDSLTELLRRLLITLAREKTKAAKKSRIKKLRDYDSLGGGVWGKRSEEPFPDFE